MLSATGFGEHANPRSSFSETLADVFSDHSSIFVTTYESRIGLMRVCIAGLEGTPYCLACSFFTCSSLLSTQISLLKSFTMLLTLI
ncbi:hypothetical protein NC652_031601 [Populus alba x Populus x berolinensis]|nr:hypothetical protein NC652_031601 [Populus alba x Populus x berolinensis]